MRLQLLSFFFCFIFLSTTLRGQRLCNTGGGSFEVTPTAGCFPLAVQFTNKTPNAVDISYAIDYRGQATPGFTTITSYRYGVVGEYTVLQKAFLTNGTIVYDCQKVSVLESRAVNAQYTSCGGGKITLSISDDAISKAYDQIQIEWGDGSADTWNKGENLTFNHNYSNTGNSPTVKLTGRYAAGKACGGGAATAIPISFQQAQLDDITIRSVEMLGQGSLRVNYQGITGIPTEIQYATNNGSFAVAGKRSSGGLQPFDIKGTNVNQVYQIKLASQDLCAGKKDSKTVSSMTISGKSEQGKNVLSWSRYPDPVGFSGYDLVRDGTILKSFTSITDITYTDEDVQCGSYSEYQIVARMTDVTSTSAPVGVKTEIAAPQPIQKAVVSVLGDNLILIKADVPGAGPNSTYDLTIEKAEAGATLFKKIITLFNQSEYSDPEVKTNELSYCYRISYTNSCGQKLPASAPICTILLNKNLTTLTWTPDLPILGGITGYDVMQTGSTGTADIIPVEMNRNYTVKLNSQSDLEYNFQIRAMSTDGTLESLSNIINYKRSAGVFVPQAFSPNGDGYNDLLEAKSTQLQAFNFSVMNRWGEVVFHSDDLTKSWDGTINGANAPVGSYVYKMTFVDDINQTVEKSGTFMLLR